MPLLGELALALALLLALYAIGASVYGARRPAPQFVASARHALWAMFALTTIAVVALLNALVNSDFTLEYVAAYSSVTLPLGYKFAALWGGQQGSLLLWTWLLTLFAAIVALQNRRRNSQIAPYVFAVLAGVAVFFLGMLNFITPPFQELAVPASRGTDLNPLLQNYWMAIHPPSLYTGYVSATVPFAFASAALITGRLDDSWIRTTRRWALFSWFFLTLGNLFGARWAYEVLGWGGYWAWDPVENAALMPWLVMTAYLHSVMIQERKDMLKVWNLALVGMAFGLTIFGTFITRSGVISSVHSFTQSGLGPYFVAFLVTAAVFYVGLLLFRLPALRTPAEFESYLSREAAFLFNNLVLMGIAFAIFWGTLFPLLSEAVRGVKITVGPPFFNQVVGPLALALMFLMGVGPLIAWRRATASKLVSCFASPTIVGVAVGLVLVWMGLRQWYVLAAFSLAAFVLATVVVEFHRGVGARRHLVAESRPRALANLVAKNNRRYGGYIVHVGVILAFAGIVGSSFFKTGVQRVFKQGETVTVGSYQLKFLGLKGTETPEVEAEYARFSLSQDGKSLGEIAPARLFYPVSRQPASKVALRSTPVNDLYVVLAAADDQAQTATVEIFLTPLVFWLWAGGLVMALGTVVAVWPDVRERAAIVAMLRSDEAIAGEPVAGGK